MKEQTGKTPFKVTKDLPLQSSPEEKKLDELIERLADTADAKGWDWRVTAKDQKKFHYATVTTERGDVFGTFEITCDDEIKLSCHNTSFYNHGLKDLRDAAWNEIKKLTWVKASVQTEKKEVSAFFIIEKLFRNFHRVARQLKHRHNDRDPFLLNDEYDIQDLLHAILRGFFEDIRAEEYTPSYAGGSSRLDFLLKNEQIVIETKMATPSLKDKHVGEQLLIDIGRYKAHQDCKYLLCLVYDPLNNLKNPHGLENDLSKKYDGMDVKVVVVSPS